VRFGLQLPYAIPATRDDLLTWARRADAGPFRTLSIGERITFHNAEQVAALAAAAAVTDRVRLLTNVTVLPIHSVALLAKSLATIDRLSGGRLIVTAGVGSRAEDFAAAGSSYTNRWQRLDDSVDAMKRLWLGEAAEPGGTQVGPPPHTAGGPPLHCAATGPKALKRAVAWACGYQGFTTNGDEDTMAGVVQRVTEAFAVAGRPRPELGVSCFFALGEGALDRLRNVVARYYGFAGAAHRAAVVGALTIASAGEMVALVQHAGAAGYDEVHFLPTTTDPAEIDRLEEALAPCVTVENEDTD